MAGSLPGESMTSPNPRSHIDAGSATIARCRTPKRAMTCGLLKFVAGTGKQRGSGTRIGSAGRFVGHGYVHGVPNRTSMWRCG